MQNVHTIFSNANKEYFYTDLGRSVLTKPTVKHVLAEIQSALMLKYTATWSSSIHNMPKLRTYRTLHRDFVVAQYARAPLSRKDRSTIAKLRNGTFPINIELGRYRGLPLNQRPCTKCDAIESEQHFLCECNAYLEESDEMFRNVNAIISNDISRLATEDILAGRNFL